jgi:hypothetical protein
MNYRELLVTKNVLRGADGMSTVDIRKPSKIRLTTRNLVRVRENVQKETYMNNLAS